MRILISTETWYAVILRFCSIATCADAGTCQCHLEHVSKPHSPSSRIPIVNDLSFSSAPRSDSNYTSIHTYNPSDHITVVVISR